jgi:hypothetical protein
LRWRRPTPNRVRGREVDFIEGEHASRNEIHELNTAVKAMHTSIDYLYRRLNKR